MHFNLTISIDIVAFGSTTSLPTFQTWLATSAFDFV